MAALLGIVGLAILFAVFAVSGIGERTRPCQGRSRSDDARCRSCPLRTEGSGATGVCVGRDEEGGPRGGSPTAP